MSGCIHDLGKDNAKQFKILADKHKQVTAWLRKEGGKEKAEEAQPSCQRAAHYFGFRLHSLC